MFKLHKMKRRHYRNTTEISISRLMMAFGLKDSTIGFISAFLVILSLIAALYSTPILEKIKEFKILVTSLVVTIISYLSIAYFKNLYFFIFISMILTIVAVFRLDSFHILFRDEAKNKTLNEEEGLMFELLNVGWFIGPLIAGFVLARYGVSSVFVMSSAFILMGLIILLTLNIKYKEKKRTYIDKNIKENITSYIKKKKLKIPYLVSAGVEIWWALIYIYVPLFIIKSGAGEEVVGIFLSAIVVPLVLLEYKAGKLSETLGFRKFLLIGYLILGSSAVIAFFSSNIYLTLVILSFSSFGMAMIEPLQDSFFFRQVKCNDEEKYYPIYATSGEIGSFLGKFLIAGVLLILPGKFAYLTIAIFMFFIAWICYNIKDHVKICNT